MEQNPTDSERNSLHFNWSTREAWTEQAVLSSASWEQKSREASAPRSSYVENRVLQISGELTVYWEPKFGFSSLSSDHHDGDDI